MILVAREINRFLIFLFFTTILFYSCNKPSFIEYTINGETMGTTYQIIIHASDNFNKNLIQSMDDKSRHIFNEKAYTCETH